MTSSTRFASAIDIQPQCSPMLSRLTAPSRRLSLRPLRPPNPPQPRLFTQKSQLLLLTHHHTPRPQIPYLAQPAFRRGGGLGLANGPSQQLARLLSTETRRYVREQFWLAVKWTTIGWTFVLLAGVAHFGWMIERDERRNPTPAEWRYRPRQNLRAARMNMAPETVEAVGFVDWPRVGYSLGMALAVLEDPERDGKGLVEGGGAGEEIWIPDVGKGGYDVSAKSWPWRAGYVEVVMGCAKAAEHMDGMVLDTTRSIVCPKEIMIGPSNPDPRPVPPYMSAAPLEENCVPPFPAPETFYMRILTGKGFTTQQRLDAALAFANWLQYKGLGDSAKEMYKWGVDIAKAGLPHGTNLDTVIDPQTSVVTDTDHATPNLLRATTDLAAHHARTGDLSSALPIFLSVLRARRTAPISDSSDLSTTDSPAPSIWRTLFVAPAFPPPPPTGDLPLTRTNDEATCDESELLLYIGEILFATSASSAPSMEGIAWTREAVAIADAHLQRRPRNNAHEGRESDDERKKCRECLLTGVGNLETMLQSAVAATRSESAPKKGWADWAFRNAGKAGMTAEALDEDLARVAALKDRIVSEGIDEQVARARGSNLSGLWIG